MPSCSAAFFFPHQWELLCSQPELAKRAIPASIRLGSPIRSFARVVSEDVEVEGTFIPKSSRVMMLFASANRNEKMFSSSDEFYLKRPVSEHLGFGHGIHTCDGMHLAQIEMQALLEALISQVQRIEILEFAPLENNMISGLSVMNGRIK